MVNLNLRVSRDNLKIYECIILKEIRLIRFYKKNGETLKIVKMFAKEKKVLNCEILIEEAKVPTVV